MIKLLCLFFMATVFINGFAFSNISHAQDAQMTASAPPAGYPVVNGVIKLITPAVNTVKIKHDAIPNLNMGAMTMTYTIAPELLLDLAKNDKIKFVADEVNGELTVLWVEKVK